MVICLCLSVKKDNANKILSYLLKKDLVRKDLKIRHDRDFVDIPVKRAPDIEGTSVQKLDFKEREIPVSPVDRINHKIEKMGFKGKFPEKFITLGNSIFIKESRMPEFPEEVYRMAAGEFQADTIYLDRGINYTSLREPDMVVLWGKGGTVIHEENGVFYSFDPAKIMFSPGNVNSRIAESKVRFKGMTVVDMFAGIGYFSLQVGKGSPKSRIFACEINPDSYSFLVQNIKRNRLEEVITPMPGDCRSSTLGIGADYIIMGHFDSPYFLSTALRMSHKGTIINMHLLCDTASIGTHWLKIQEMARNLGYIMDFQGQGVVKSYGPHLWHISTKFEIVSAL